MKKSYVTLWLNVTTFENDDVVTASIAYNTTQYGVGVDAKDTWWKSTTFSDGQ